MFDSDSDRSEKEDKKRTMEAKWGFDGDETCKVIRILAHQSVSCLFVEYVCLDKEFSLCYFIERVAELLTLWRKS